VKRLAWWNYAVVVLAYFGSSFLHAPLSDRLDNPLPHFVLYRWFYFSPPIVFSGDSPHYLVIVHSIIEDFDLDVANNYAQARSGDFDLGIRYRRFELDRHAEAAGSGEQYSLHPPYMPMVLAVFAWPFRGTAWVEPVSIWVTMAAGLGAVFILGRLAGVQGWLLLAFATPLWCYSRDLWTEPWTAATWAALLVFRNPWALFGIAFAGVLLRYPFSLVVLIAGLVFLWKGERTRAVALVAGAGLSLVVGFLVAQYVYAETGHFSLLHAGYHVAGSGSGEHSFLLAPFRLQLSGLYGLLVDPGKGLLMFSPFLAWGLWRFPKGGILYLPAIGYFLLIAFYSEWGGGSTFSARYLVPMLPVTVLGVSEEKPRAVVFKILVAWSMIWAVVGGLAPALVYDRSPVDVFSHLLEKSTKWLPW